MSSCGLTTGPRCYPFSYPNSNPTKSQILISYHRCGFFSPQSQKIYSQNFFQKKIVILWLFRAPQNFWKNFVGECPTGPRCFRFFYILHQLFTTKNTRLKNSRHSRNGGNPVPRRDQSILTFNSPPPLLAVGGSNNIQPPKTTKKIRT